MAAYTIVDYYPFGMAMPGRKYEATSNYRYGFNGKENDNEVKGIEGGQQDYGMRIYDPRIGKFLSVDPIAIEFPWNSAYAFAENGPISNIDLDGLERKGTILGDIATGIRLRANEITSKIKGTGKKLTTTQTYKDAANGVVDYAKTAVNDPNKAIQKFNQGVFNLSMSFSNTIQEYTVRPALWTITIPQRTKEENLIGLGYGLTKAVEMYVLFRAPEIFEESVGSTNVDLMGGRQSRYGPGFINYDLKAATGITDDVVNFKRYFPKNSVTKIIVDNPQAEFLQHVSESLEDGGVIIVRGNMSNKYFKSVYEGKAKGMEDFEVSVMKPNVENPGYKKTSGEDIQGQINELQLKKKSK